MWIIAGLLAIPILGLSLWGIINYYLFAFRVLSFPFRYLRRIWFYRQAPIMKSIFAPWKPEKATLAPPNPRLLPKARGFMERVVLKQIQFQSSKKAHVLMMAGHRVQYMRTYHRQKAMDFFRIPLSVNIQIQGGPLSKTPVKQGKELFTGIKDITAAFHLYGQYQKIPIFLFREDFRKELCALLRVFPKTRLIWSETLEILFPSPGNAGFWGNGVKPEVNSQYLDFIGRLGRILEMVQSTDNLEDFTLRLLKEESFQEVKESFLVWISLFFPSGPIPWKQLGLESRDFPFALSLEPPRGLSGFLSWTRAPRNLQGMISEAFLSGNFELPGVLIKTIWHTHGEYQKQEILMGIHRNPGTGYTDFLIKCIEEESIPHLQTLYHRLGECATIEDIQKIRNLPHRSMTSGTVRMIQERYGRTEQGGLSILDEPEVGELSLAEGKDADQSKPGPKKLE